MPMQPSPSADTSSPSLPSVRRCIVFSLAADPLADSAAWWRLLPLEMPSARASLGRAARFSKDRAREAPHRLLVAEGDDRAVDEEPFARTLFDERGEEVVGQPFAADRYCAMGRDPVEIV